MTDGVDGPRATPRRNTRLALIEAAERLFSAEGVSSVSLRRITQAAGQRNESAIHYHFGSREGVVAAIMDLRTLPIDAERRALLARMRAEAGGRPLSSRDVAEALCRPLAEHLRATAGRGCYLRFLGMLWLDRPMWREFENRSQDQGLIEARSALAEAKPHMPETLLRHRFSIALQTSTYAMARMERLAEEMGPRWRWSRAEVQISNIVDAIQAIFDAPLSPGTVQALRRDGALPAHHAPSAGEDQRIDDGDAGAGRPDDDGVEVE